MDAYRGHYWMLADRCSVPAVRGPPKTGPETPHAESCRFRLQTSKHRACATRKSAEPTLSNKHELQPQPHQFCVGLSSGMNELASAPHALDMPSLRAETPVRSSECGSSPPRKRCVGGRNSFNPSRSPPRSIAARTCSRVHPSACASAKSQPGLTPLGGLTRRNVNFTPLAPAAAAASDRSKDSA